MIYSVGIFLGILLDASALNVLQLLHILQLLLRDAVRVVDVAIRVGERHGDGTQLDALLGGILCHVARTGDEHLLALDVDIAGLQHRVQEVNTAVAGGLGADE